MIIKAAVKIHDKRLNKETIIPCFRHGDAFLILKEFGYKKGTDYEEIAQGFLDNKNQFYTRKEASIWMKEHGQKTRFNDFPDEELYSEDLY